MIEIKTTSNVPLTFHHSMKNDLVIISANGTEMIRVTDKDELYFKGELITIESQLVEKIRSTFEGHLVEARDRKTLDALRERAEQFAYREWRAGSLHRSDAITDFIEGDIDVMLKESR